MLEEGSVFLSAHSGAVWLELILLKSFVVLGVFLGVDQLLRAKLASSVRSFFLLMAYVSLFIQPLSAAVSPMLNEVLVLTNVISFSFEVIGGSERTANYRDTLVLLYLLMVLALATRLAWGLMRLRTLNCTNKVVIAPASLAILSNAKSRLGISRTVQLRLNARVSSPLSFGLFRPQIVLPMQAHNWPSSMMEHVLLHELVHIKRFDWLRVLLAYGVATLFWVNPFSWLLMARIRSCTEDACDEEVVSLEGSGANYAQNLLAVARQCNAASLNSAGLAQSMLGHSSLKFRIQQIMETKIMKTKALQSQFKKVVALSCVLSAVLFFGMSGSNIVAAQNRQPVNTSPTRGQEFLPVHTVVPYYPSKAAEQSIEGWVQVQFNVGTQGQVIESSIEIVDAEPATIFNESAKAAIAQFRFTEYAPDGFAVIVPEVQYVFRYKMQDDN